MKSIIYSFGTFDLLPRSPVFLLLSHSSPSLSILPDQSLLPSVFTVRICLVHTANLPFFLLAAGTEGNRMKVWHFLHRRKSEVIVLAERQEFVGLVSEKWKKSEVAISTSGLWSCKVQLWLLWLWENFKWTVGPSLLCYPKQKPYLHRPILGGTSDSDV